MTSVADRASFRGPYADGPPPEALLVDPPPLRIFGVAEVRRFFTIGAVMGLCVARALARWLFHPRRAVSPGDTPQPPGWRAAVSTGVVDALCALGPMFIKLGQLLGSSPSTCPAPLSDAARRCIREVDPLDVTVVRAVIERDLGRPVDDLFASFEDRPLSAASVAQVHGCVLPDGREAVVKVQRPELRATVTADLRIQWRLMRLLERLSGFARDANCHGYHDKHPDTDGYTDADAYRH